MLRSSLRLANCTRVSRSHGHTFKVSQHGLPSCMRLCTRTSAGTGKSPLWTEHKDPDTGETYYFNEVSKESTWERPAALDAEALPSPPPVPSIPKGTDPRGNACPEVDQVWATLDVNGDGELSKDEVKILISRLGAGLVETGQVAGIFKQMDALGNKDGKVTKDEFEAWWAGQAGRSVPFDTLVQHAPGWGTRLCGGIIDFTVYCLIVPSAALIGLSTLAPEMGLVGGGATFIVGSVCYTFRDASKEGRSIGKRKMGMEIVQLQHKVSLDGQMYYMPTSVPATRGMGFMRNAYTLLTGVPFIGGVVAWTDTSLILFSQNRRSVGDHLAKTMVVPEGPDFAKRVEDRGSQGLLVELRKVQSHLKNVSEATTSPPQNAPTPYPYVGHVVLGLVFGGGASLLAADYLDQAGAIAAFVAASN